MIEERTLEIRSYSGEGYKPLITYDGWRVAVLNFLEELHPSRIEYLERHLQTDEVFVLTKGRGVLLLGGNASEVKEAAACEMETGKIYNVRANTWHSVLLSPDASVLIVENSDTGKENTEYWGINRGVRNQIMEFAHQYAFI
jgi:mannose-6-phosphate isomerase-like protein (cupin superfamily)